MSGGTGGNTPKKLAQKVGRKSKPESVNDFCRLCDCNLKIKFGEFGKTSYVSSENLFKKGINDARSLQELCLELDVSVEKSVEFSERVCKACGRKIRNAHQLITVIKHGFQKPFVGGETNRVKRHLPTTVSSPERSPQRRKSSKPAATPALRSKRSLTFGDPPSLRLSSDNRDKENTGIPDQLLAELNIETSKLTLK